MHNDSITIVTSTESDSYIGLSRFPTVRDWHVGALDLSSVLDSLAPLDLLLSLLSSTSIEAEIRGASALLLVSAVELAYSLGLTTIAQRLARLVLPHGETTCLLQGKEERLFLNDRSPILFLQSLRSPYRHAVWGWTRGELFISLLEVEDSWLQELGSHLSAPELQMFRGVVEPAQWLMLYIGRGIPPNRSLFSVLSAVEISYLPLQPDGRLRRWAEAMGEEALLSYWDEMDKPISGWAPPFPYNTDEAEVSLPLVSWTAQRTPHRAG